VKYVLDINDALSRRLIRSYYTNLANNTKEDIVKAFENREILVVVATITFGFRVNLKEVK